MLNIRKANKELNANYDVKYATNNSLTDGMDINIKKFCKQKINFVKKRLFDNNSEIICGGGRKLSAKDMMMTLKGQIEVLLKNQLSIMCILQINIY